MLLDITNIGPCLQVAAVLEDADFGEGVANQVPIEGLWTQLDDDPTADDADGVVTLGTTPDATSDSSWMGKWVSHVPTEGLLLKLTTHSSCVLIAALFVEEGKTGVNHVPTEGLKTKPEPTSADDEAEGIGGGSSLATTCRLATSQVPTEGNCEDLHRCAGFGVCGGAEVGNLLYNFAKQAALRLWKFSA